jgi:hypothetical protein
MAFEYSSNFDAKEFIEVKEKGIDGDPNQLRCPFCRKDKGCEDASDCEYFFAEGHDEFYWDAEGIQMLTDVFEEIRDTGLTDKEYDDLNALLKTTEIGKILINSSVIMDWPPYPNAIIETILMDYQKPDGSEPIKWVSFYDDSWGMGAGSFFMAFAEKQDRAHIEQQCKETSILIRGFLEKKNHPISCGPGKQIRTLHLKFSDNEELYCLDQDKVRNFLKENSSDVKSFFLEHISFRHLDPDNCKLDYKSLHQLLQAKQMKNSGSEMSHFLINSVCAEAILETDEPVPIKTLDVLSQSSALDEPTARTIKLSFQSPYVFALSMLSGGKKGGAGVFHVEKGVWLFSCKEFLDGLIYLRDRELFASYSTFLYHVGTTLTRSSRLFLITPDGAKASLDLQGDRGIPDMGDPAQSHLIAEDPLPDRSACDAIVSRVFSSGRYYYVAGGKLFVELDYSHFSIDLDLVMEQAHFDQE